jgi:hypothetical protein
MTPLEIAEYKQRWMAKGGYPVCLHSDLDIEGKDWCRRNLERHQWSFKPHTDVYEHTFYFEDRSVSQQFEHEFIHWVNR